MGILLEKVKPSGCYILFQSFLFICMLLFKLHVCHLIIIKPTFYATNRQAKMPLQSRIKKKKKYFKSKERKAILHTQIFLLPC